MSDAPGPQATPGRAGAVAITGMHRSGTSMAARVLALLGVSLGDESLLAPPGADNPAGYWENHLVREVDDLVLAALGGSWDRPPVLEAGWADDPRLDELRAEAATILDRTFGAPPERPATYGFKDPRLCLLCPFWSTVVSFDAKVLVVRDPAQVVDSLHVRNGFSAAQGAGLWLRYLCAAVADGGRLVAVDHALLLDDVGAAMASLADQLGLPEPTPAAVAAAQAHLDPSLTHHQRRSRDALGVDHDANPVVRLAADVYADGAFDTSVLDPLVLDALAAGWLRPPAADDQLAAARARSVELEERLRRQKRRWDAERAARGAAR